MELEKLKTRLNNIGIVGEGLDLKSFAVTIPLVEEKVNGRFFFK
ncbi:hypothetical protein [Caloramator sp. Dgby_cultured_2]|nr:hypothetical protein [Caloramator sp. Dgby_cultured_2]WDU83669.1 hypothetical protein PWK10_03500 [Caloramator sp. Dgby_cultured_2]